MTDHKGVRRRDAYDTIANGSVWIVLDSGVMRSEVLALRCLQKAHDVDEEVYILLKTTS